MYRSIMAACLGALTLGIPAIPQQAIAPKVGAAPPLDKRLRNKRSRQIPT